MNKSAIYTVLAILIIAAHLLIFHSFANSARYNNLVFGFETITSDAQRFQICKRIGLFLSMFLLFFALAIMTYRVTTGNTNPASGKDNQMIMTFNRVITNTIEQSAIFGGLYVNFLYGAYGISENLILLLGSLFIIGRLAFGIGYVCATMTRISTLRSFGVSINFFLVVLMTLYVLGFNLFDKLEKFNVLPF